MPFPAPAHQGLWLVTTALANDTLPLPEANINLFKSSSWQQLPCGTVVPRVPNHVLISQYNVRPGDVECLRNRERDMFSLFDRPSLSCASLTYVSGWWSGACKTLKPVKGISAREKKAFNSRVNEIYEYWSERESRWDELQDDSEMEELQGHSQAERSEVEVIV